MRCKDCEEVQLGLPDGDLELDRESPRVALCVRVWLALQVAETLPDVEGDAVKVSVRCRLSVKLLL